MEKTLDFLDYMITILVHSTGGELYRGDANAIVGDLINMGHSRANKTDLSECWRARHYTELYDAVRKHPNAIVINSFLDEMECMKARFPYSQHITADEKQIIMMSIDVLEKWARSKQ